MNSSQKSIVKYIYMIRVDEPHISWAIVRSLGQPDIDLIDHFMVGLVISCLVWLVKQIS